MEQENTNTITIDTTNLENYRVGLEDKLYGIDNTIKTQLLEQLDEVFNGLKCYNGKEIKKEEGGFGIDITLYILNKYIDGLNEDKKLTNSLVFGVIKSVIEDFRKEYYNTIGIDISEEKEEDVSVNRVRYFDKYLNNKDEIEGYVTRYCDACKYYFNLINLGNTTQEQQEVYFGEDEKSLKSKTSSNSSFSSSDNYEKSLKSKTSSSSSYFSLLDDKESSKSTTSSSSLSFTLSDDDKKYLKSNNSLSEYYTFATKEIEEVIVGQVNSRSSSPVSDFE